MKKQAHLFVDGYNVIHGLPESEDIFHRDKELVHIVRSIHDGDGTRVTLGSDGSGVDHEIVRPGQALTFSYLLASAASTADGVIEGLLANESEPSTVTVVTRDRTILHSTLEAGGTVMDPEGMVSWSERSSSEELGRAARTRELEDERFGVDIGSLLS